MITNSFMSSRSRLLAALNREPVDHTPCSFMLFKGLWGISTDYLDFIKRQINMGLDAYVQIPHREPGEVSDSYNLHGLPVHHHPSVIVREWKELIPEERCPILVKEYDTPSGKLRAEVRQDEDWPYGDHVPFLDDYIESRSRKFIIQNKEDLAALEYLLIPPSNRMIRDFQAKAQPILEFAHQNDLLVAGGWGVGADLIGWVFGLQNMIFAAYDQPDLLADMLRLIHTWNQSRMDVVLNMGVDLYIKRAWYENTDFWSPKLWRKFIFPIIELDAALAHKKNALFGYLITANCMPLLEMIVEAGVDVIIGVDPANWDLSDAVERVGGKICLWGGVNGHQTVELGDISDVQLEVQQALQISGKVGSFILSPVDNIRDYNSVSQQNVFSLIDEWQKLTGQIR